MPIHSIHCTLLGTLLAMCWSFAGIHSVSATPPGLVRISDKAAEGKVSLSGQSATLGKTIAAKPVSTLVRPASAADSFQVPAGNPTALNTRATTAPATAKASDSLSDSRNRRTNALQSTTRRADHKDAGDATRFKEQSESVDPFLLNVDRQTQLQVEGALPARRAAGRAGIQQASYDVTDGEPGQILRSGTPASSSNSHAGSAVVRRDDAAIPLDKPANTPMALRASPTTRQIPLRDQKPGNSSGTGIPNRPDTNAPPASNQVAQNAAGSQTLPGSASNPFPRVERKPQQFPIQRDIPAPRTASLSILQREAQEITENEAGQGDDNSTAGDESFGTQDATKRISGTVTALAPRLSAQEPQQRDQTTDADDTSPVRTPGTSQHSESQPRPNIPLRGTSQLPGAAGDVIEIWYGEEQVFQSRNTPVGRQPELNGRRSTQDPSVTSLNNQPGETHAAAGKHSGVSPVDQSGEPAEPSKSAIATPIQPVATADASGETLETEKADQPPLPELPQESDHENPRADAGDSSVLKSASDSQLFVPLTHAASELAPVPPASREDATDEDDQGRRTSRPVFSIPFPDASGDSAGRTIQQIKFEDLSANLPAQHEDSQRAAGLPAAASTDLSGTDNKSLSRIEQAHTLQTEAALLLASPGKLIWPIVAIAFALLFGVAVIFLLLVISLRLIRPGHQQPICRISVVNGDRAVETDSEFDVHPDQAAHWNGSVENGLDHPLQRIRHSEPHSPVRHGFAKRMMSSALHSSAFRRAPQPEPQPPEPSMSHGGIMDDILRQNLAIRDQRPRKWTEN